MNSIYNNKLVITLSILCGYSIGYCYNKIKTRTI